ncbi:hypothetical protein [Pontibacillus sp. HMF3514]|nr:hypothetical protein [Pontibacillus sp. HMF3514]
MSFPLKVVDNVMLFTNRLKTYGNLVTIDRLCCTKKLEPVIPAQAF